MPVATSLIVIPTLTLFGSLYLLRQRVSSKWIHLGKSRFLSDTISSNLNGKTILITGGNTGLGYHTAKDLAKRNATIVLACRNIPAAEEAIAKITKETGNPTMDCMPLDLADLSSVQTFSKAFIEKYPNVYAVICNAGVFIPMEEKRKTRDNYEIHFGINHLGHFALIKNLHPHLQKSDETSRFIIVSSGLMKNGKIDMEKRDFIRDGRPEEVDEKGKKRQSHAPTGYCDSKLMNALTCKYLAKAYPNDTPPDESVESKNNVRFYAVCPGWCKTDLGRHTHFPFYKKIMFTPIMFMFMRSGQQGAQNILFATLEDEKVLQNGGFYRDGKVAEDETKYVEDLMEENLDKKLWDLSEELIAVSKK